MDHLSSIDHGYINTTADVGRMGELGSLLLEQNSLTGCYTFRNDEHLGKRIYNGDFPLYYGNDVDYKVVEMCSKDDRELRNAIEYMVIRSLKRLPKRLHETLHDNVTQFSDVFRIKLGKDPPVNVPTMKI